MRKCLIMLGVLAVMLSGCGGGRRELPPPAELFAAVQDQVELPDMVDTAGTDLEGLTGIGPEAYDAAVCCRLLEGTAPDEIIIVRARDDEAAGEIEALLEKRLEYKQRSGELYLTEYQPMLRDGAVRRDGLTVSLIVSEKAAEIAQVYDAQR